MNFQEIKTKRAALKGRAQTIFYECWKVNPNAYDNYLKKYWTKLFEDDLAIVRAKADSDRDKLQLPDQGGAHMILTIGGSIEPLVLAVHLVKPASIFVLYNEQEHLTKFTDCLVDSEYCDSSKNAENIIRGIQIPASNAAALFRMLYNKGGNRLNNTREQHGYLKDIDAILQNENRRKNVIFDITGAKKTISGGCLLFAAYYELPVYYMDFGGADDYDPDLGRPYPGSSRYTRQANPITGFCIRDIKSIGTAFDSGRFATAATLLEPLITKMRNDREEYFDKTEIDIYEGLRKLTMVYDDWQNDWWGDVFSELETLPQPSREFTKYVKNYPTKKKQHHSSKQQTDFYDDLDGFAAYVALELASLLRQQDILHPRDLFSRTYALEEIVVSFIWYRLYQKNPNICHVKNSSKQQDDAALEKAVCGSYGRLEEFLLKNKNYKVEKKIVIIEIINEGITNSIRDQLQFFKENRNLRNKAVHRTQPVSEQTARDAIKTMEKLFVLLLDDPCWFDENSTASDIGKLIKGNNEWFKDKQVSPITWKDAENIIQAAVSGVNSNQ